MPVQVIIHAVNPPGYRNWDKLVLPMIENSIAAAAASGARIVLPGTLYNFDPDTSPLITETTPQFPKTRKGAIAAGTTGATLDKPRTGRGRSQLGLSAGPGGDDRALAGRS